MLTADQIKKQVGFEAAKRIENGMNIGAGTGSTSYWFIQALGDRVKSGLSCKVVPTSKQTEKLLNELHIPVIDLNSVATLDLVIDGADEIDPGLQLIKGGGGALLQEKMVAAAAKHYLIIADESKLVGNLGQFPLPVEVIPYGYKQVIRLLEEKFGQIASLRKKGVAPFITDHQNYILDINFKHIPKPVEVAAYLKTIPGLVEHGLFLNMAREAIIGSGEGLIKILHSRTG
jgi:ribose 5-phosphate isomerase A